MKKPHSESSPSAEKMPESFPIPALRTLIWRGCRKKCPRCGQGAIYQGWIKLHEQCPVCGLKYLTNQGDLWGPLLFFDRLLFLIPLIVIVYFRKFNSDMTWLVLGGGTMIFLLVYTLPNRNGISLAVDYLMRRKGGDLVDEDSTRK